MRTWPDLRKKGEVDTDYPKLVVPNGIRCHPNPAMHIWLVKLKNDAVEHTVAFGNLREWLNKYAR